MSKLYSSPLRVYVLLGALALLGIFSGLKLPISLFPNSSKPDIYVEIPFGSMTAEEFLNSYGMRLETQLHDIATNEVEVEKMDSDYEASQVEYHLKFKWGVDPQAALREVQTVVNSFSAQLPQEIRNQLRVDLYRESQGFFALTFFSDKRSTTELYELLEPILTPRLNRVRDAQDPILFNPSETEIRVVLQPQAMAALQLFPSDIENAISGSLGGHTGGSVTMGGSELLIQMPRQIQQMGDIGQIPVTTPAGKTIHLGEVARVEVGPRTSNSQSWKTNGAPSVILYAVPRAGGNVKRMSEEMLKIVDQLMPTLPKDIQYRKIVDPSEFIRSAVNNVFHEVAIAAILAVLVLFVFIGSFRNVVTAAIEIPMSMVLAFILMRVSGMNLNLISLGGLALSAGMNVDASVVVMENIFRHFEMEPGPHDFATRLRILTEAVKEVRFAVLASTVASLVVFLPLTFTSDLSYAILGDLAKAVVFSHGFSALIALVLVPTVRLQLMAKEEKPHHSPIEKQLDWLESRYSRALGLFLERPALKWGAYAGLLCLLGALATLVLPRLPKEIVGLPDTDILQLVINTQGNTLAKQMEDRTGEIERDLLARFGNDVAYTFSMVNGPNFSVIFVRMKDKSHMRELWKNLEAHFTSTPDTHFETVPWNPSELPIPNPPDLRIAIRGGTALERAIAALDVRDIIQGQHILPDVELSPDSASTHSIILTPHLEQWEALKNEGAKFTASDLADLIRVATNGRWIAYFPNKDRQTDIVMKYPTFTINSVEDVAAFPIGVGSKLVPLKALVDVAIRESAPTIYREDERDLFLVEGRENMVDKANAAKDLETAKRAVGEWEKEARKNGKLPAGLTINFEDAAHDLTDAIHQLAIAVGLSVALIFLTMVIQFGTFIEPCLVLISVPLGFIGVLVSLFVFRSTLSLNSILGVILLNGIAVANSIILVDFIKRRSEAGLPPREAAMDAAQKRLRPILITSLTTVLGMLPIALGTGEGGRILQPLGIAVSGGLWVSMGLTLFLVPAMQVTYLEWREARGLSRFRITWWKLFKPATVALLLIGLSTSARATDSDAPVSFEQALRTIVERHPQVGIERANLDGLTAKNLPSHLALLPSLSVSASDEYDDAFGLRYETRSLKGDAKLNIFHFGADVAGMSAASEAERAQEHTLGDAMIKAEDEGVKALVGQIQADMEVQTLQHIVQLRSDSLDVSKLRFRSGLLASQEVDKVSVDLDNARAQLRDAQVKEVSAHATLRALLGGDTVKAEWPWRDRWTDRPIPLVQISDSQLSQRPDWQAAEHSRQSAEDGIRQTFGLMMPSLDADFNYGLSQNSGGVFPDQGGVFPAYAGPAWSASVALSIPLFDRLTNYGAYRAQIAQKSSAEMQLEKIKRQARSDWETARGSLEMALQSARERDQTLALSRRLYQDGLKRFREGYADANQLELDQQRLYDSELHDIEGWATVHTNYAQLCHALGMRVDECLRK